MSSTVMAMFDTYSDALSALRDLARFGFRPVELGLVTTDRREATPPADDPMVSLGVGMFPGGEAGPAGAAAPGVEGATAQSGQAGFASPGELLANLTSLGLPEVEAQAYIEGVRRGASLVSVRTADAEVANTREILIRNGAVNYPASWAPSGPAAAELHPRSRMDTARSGHEEYIPSHGDTALGHEPEPDFARGQREQPVPDREPDFARGQHEQPAPDREPDFARGQREQPVPDRHPDFARGQHAEPAPEREASFARGQRERLAPDRDPDFARGQRERPAPDRHPDFARGQHPESASDRDPDFARGQREQPAPDRHPDFARGQHAEPAPGPEPDFARGQRELDQDELAFYNHYRSLTGAGGRSFDYYKPGYQFGYELARDQSLRHASWPAAEVDVRTRWEREARGSWEEFHQVIRFGWEQARGNGPRT